MKTTNAALLIKAGKDVIAMLSTCTMSKALIEWNACVEQAGYFTVYDFPTTGYTRKAQIIADLERCIKQLEEVVANELDAVSFENVAKDVMKHTPVAAIEEAVGVQASISHSVSTGYSVYFQYVKLNAVGEKVEACSFLIGSFFSEQNANKAVALALEAVSGVRPIQAVTVETITRVFGEYSPTIELAKADFKNEEIVMSTTINTTRESIHAFLRTKEESAALIVLFDGWMNHNYVSVEDFIHDVPDWAVADLSAAFNLCGEAISVFILSDDESQYVSEREMIRRAVSAEMALNPEREAAVVAEILNDVTSA